MAYERPLYCMVKPPRAVARLIGDELGSSRASDLLHITLLSLGDRRDYSDLDLAELIECLRRTQFFAFRVVFDQVHESDRTVALRPSEQIEGALAFQRALRAELMREGIGLPVYNFRPHITLSYGRDGLGSAPIDPISWLVEDFRLIESVHGEGRHSEHARFPLLLPMPMAA